MPNTESNKQPKAPFTAHPERVHEGARQILESDVQSATEDLVRRASFNDLITWDAILAFWNDEPSNGLLGAITKVADAPEGEEEEGEDAENPETNVSLKDLTLHQLRQQAKDKERDRFFASALDVTDLDEHEAALLAVCQRLLREHRSTDTPIEEFIWHLLFSARYHALTLQDVQQEMEELERNWDDALETAKKFHEEYRELVGASESKQ